MCHRNKPRTVVLAQSLRVSHCFGGKFCVSAGQERARAGLKDPTLELANANGSTIFFNNNWQDTQSAEIQATGLAPSNVKESAIVANLDPGSYRAIVRGNKNKTGIGTVEVYTLP